MAPSCGTQITFRSQFVLCSKKLKSTAFCFDLYSVVLLFIHLRRLTSTHWTTPLKSGSRLQKWSVVDQIIIKVPSYVLFLPPVCMCVSVYLCVLVPVHYVLLAISLELLMNEKIILEFTGPSQHRLSFYLPLTAPLFLWRRRLCPLISGAHAFWLLQNFHEQFSALLCKFL